MALSPPSPGQYDDARVDGAEVGDAASPRDVWPEALERRSGTRQRSKVAVEIEAEALHANAEVVNHGPGGFYLECPEEIEPGHALTVVCRGKRRQAEVVHLRKVPRSLTGMRLPGVGVRLLD